MCKGWMRSLFEIDQVTIPDAYIIDELDKEERDVHSTDNSYRMPCLYEIDHEQASSSTPEEHQTVIIIEL